MERKYQVFISSTFNDLKEERMEIMEALTNLGHIPVGMELFNAADDTQWAVIKRRIDESDYYILILSDRYGSLDSDGVGFTEKEYEHAIEMEKPVIAFIREENAINALEFEHRESNNREKLDGFRKKLEKRLYKKWINKHDLSKKFYASFIELIKDHPQSGWIRYELINEEKTDQYNQLFNDNQKLSDENRFLNTTLTDIKNELSKFKEIENKAESIVNILPQKEYYLGEFKFNGIELVSIFGNFVAIEGPLSKIVDSIQKFLKVQIQDEEHSIFQNDDSIKYIVGSFACLGLIEIKSETHILHRERREGKKDRKNDTDTESYYDKRDEIENLQTVFPTPLLSEVYNKIYADNIDSIFISNENYEYARMAKRLKGLTNFEKDVWSEHRDEYKKRKIDSIIAEFIGLAKWSSYDEKNNFYAMDFYNDSKALGELLSKANEVLQKMKNESSA